MVTRRAGSLDAGAVNILWVVGWTGLARVVRGKLLELREADFVMAARVAGTREGRIIAQLPSSVGRNGMTAVGRK